MTLPSADSDLLILAPSLSRSPVAPLRSALSEPAIHFTPLTIKHYVNSHDSKSYVYKGTSIWSIKLHIVYNYAYSVYKQQRFLHKKEPLSHFQKITPANQINFGVQGRNKICFWCIWHNLWYCQLQQNDKWYIMFSVGEVFMLLDKQPAVKFLVSRHWTYMYMTIRWPLNKPVGDWFARC